VSAVLGAALLWLAVPRTIAAWAGLAAQPALEKLQEDKAPSTVELAEGVQGLQRAISWVPSARRLTDLGLLELAQALATAPEDPGRPARLASAEKHVTEGLARNPVNGFAWLRLASIRELRGAEPRKVAAAVMQSLDMAPNTRKLWMPRAAMFLAYWPHLAEDEVPAVRAQLRTIWTAHEMFRLALLEAAQRNGRVLLIGNAIADDPQALAEFQKLTMPVPRSEPRSAPR
jgi:hypothetical protein